MGLRVPRQGSLSRRPGRSRRVLRRVGRRGCGCCRIWRSAQAMLGLAVGAPALTAAFWRARWAARLGDRARAAGGRSRRHACSCRSRRRPLVFAATRPGCSVASPALGRVGAGEGVMMSAAVLWLLRLSGSRSGAAGRSGTSGLRTTARLTGWDVPRWFLELPPTSRWGTGPGAVFVGERAADLQVVALGPRAPDGPLEQAVAPARTGLRRGDMYPQEVVRRPTIVELRADAASPRLGQLPVASARFSRYVDAAVQFGTRATESQLRRRAGDGALRSRCAGRSATVNVGGGHWPKTSSRELPDARVQALRDADHVGPPATPLAANSALAILVRAVAVLDFVCERWRA